MTETPSSPAEQPERTPQEAAQDAASGAADPRTPEQSAPAEQAPAQQAPVEQAQWMPEQPSSEQHSPAQTVSAPEAQEPHSQEPQTPYASQTLPAEPLPPYAQASQAATPVQPTPPTQPAQWAQGTPNPYAPAAPTAGYAAPGQQPASAYQQPQHQQQYGGYGQPYQNQTGHYATAPQNYAPPQAQPTQQAAQQPQTTQSQPAPADSQQTQPLPPFQQANAFGPAAQGPGEAAPKEPRDPEKRNRAGLLITGFVLAGLLGGGVGAGVVGIYAANNSGGKTVTSTGASNITVNDPKTATNVTAVASNAMPSVVTINATSSSANAAGTGSGIVLSADGYVVTNTHVVTLDGATGNASLTATTSDGKIFQAKVVGTDPILDLAVIKLQNASGLKPAKFADSDKVNVGDSAIAIGAPLGLSGTVTNGIVSALNRSIQVASSAAPSQDQQQGGSNNSPFNFWNDQGGSGSQQQQAQTYISLPVIQTDAPINPGNSGGALLNSKGDVIGVNVAIASTGSSSSSSGSQSGSIGVGFAIPANVAQRVAQEIIKDGKATSGLLGATVSDAGSSSNATTLGAIIKSVTPGGAAANAGLQAGDIVTNFNGKPITNGTDLTAQVRALAAGATAKVTYVSGSSTKTVNVTLGTLTGS